MKYLAILLVAFVGVSNAAFFDRPCRENVTVKSNFNVNQVSFICIVVFHLRRKWLLKVLNFHLVSWKLV